MIITEILNLLEVKHETFYVYHGTSIDAANDIINNGIDNEKSEKGYFGTGFYTSENIELVRSNYAHNDELDSLGKILKFKVSNNAKLLDLRDKNDWEFWKKNQFEKRIHQNDFWKIMQKYGIDGLYDDSFEGWVFYNPDVLSFVKELEN